MENTSEPTPTASALLDIVSLDSLLQEAKRLAVELTENWHPVVNIPRSMGGVSTREHPHRPPRCGGVYIIKHKTDGVLYVGKASDLSKRLCGQHLSRNSDEKSFQAELRSKFNLTLEQVVPFLDEHCDAAWLAIHDDNRIRQSAMICLVEQLAIAWMCSGNHPLLNKIKGR